MPFVGEVNVKIFFGTKFNQINVPYTTDLIESSASKIISRPAQVVWQSTWLTHLRVNVADYQDIVGAQYVKMEDTGVTDFGVHWYSVVGYQQISRGCVELGIAYDPLLSIGINNIKEISGIMHRWTVDDDTPFRYTLSPEPINQIDDYEYHYTVINPITNMTGTLNIVGCAVDLDTPPEILQYQNADGTQTSIYYPKMVRATPTNFSSRIGGVHTYNDGLTYFLWSAEKIRDNFDAATGLAYDLQTVAYKLPLTNLIRAHYDGNKVTSIDGDSNETSMTAVGGVGIRNTAVQNSKAGEMGTFFTLYNTVTGDSVTVSNYDLDNLNVTLYADPSFNGRFFARFSGYLGDNQTATGLVKSAGWQPMTISSNTGYGSVLAQANNAMSMRQVQTVQDIGVSTATSNFIAGTLNTVGHTFDRAMSEQASYEHARAMAKGEQNVINQLSNGHTFRNIGMYGGAIMQELAMFVQFTAQLKAVNQYAETQKANLAVQGTLGRNTPPTVKYAGTEVYAADAYKFGIRATTISEKDRQRADRFFTAYGYNVDNAVLNSPAQLKCRKRFTFIQADDVFIGAATPINYTRTHDLQTQDYIKERFSNGLRIWQTVPDYDWTKPNEIGG